MRTIRRRLTIWYTVALGITIAAFGTLLYLSGVSPASRELDQRLGLEADLANRWLSESYNVLGRIVTTAGDAVPSLDPGISAYLEAVRDYVVVSDTNGNVLALSEACAHAHRRRRSSVSPRRSTPCRLPKRAGHDRLGAPRGRGALPRRARGGAPGPEIGGLLVATPIGQMAFGPARAAPVHADHRAGRSCSRRRWWATGWRGRRSGRCRASWTRSRRSPTGGACTGGSRCRCPATRWPARADGERHARPAGAELREPASVHRGREPRAQDPADGAPGRRRARAGAPWRARRDHRSRSTRRSRRSTR